MNDILRSPGALLKEAKNFGDNEESDFLTAAELRIHIVRCISNSRQSQKKIYTVFYQFALSICTRYTNNRPHVMQLLNEGFLKIFKQIRNYTPAHIDEVTAFKQWMYKMIAETAVDYFSKAHKRQPLSLMKNEKAECHSVAAVEKLASYT